MIKGVFFDVGGTLYTGFETFTGVSRSFGSFAASGMTAGVAGILDNGSTTQQASVATLTLIDQVASAPDVNAAMAQLTPAAFQSFSTIGVST